MTVEPPEAYGDVWTDELTADEAGLVASYFESIEHLGDCLEFVNVRVGGRDNVIPLGKNVPRGITFEVPRASLLKAVQWRIFDDLLIGNFMKTTLHGKWPASKLSPDVTPYVAKYADNGGARTHEELTDYFDEYRRRLGTSRYVRHIVERRAKHVVQTRWGSSTQGLDLASRAYRHIMSRT
jgi:hypothetical protein